MRPWQLSSETVRCVSGVSEYCDESYEEVEDVDPDEDDHDEALALREGAYKEEFEFEFVLPYSIY
jgi:hypothetical protein